jgi:hypothetical protein
MPDKAGEQTLAYARAAVKDSILSPGGGGSGGMLHRHRGKNTVYPPAALLQEPDKLLPLRRGSVMDNFLNELLILLKLRVSHCFPAECRHHYSVWYTVQTLHWCTKPWGLYCEG